MWPLCVCLFVTLHSPSSPSLLCPGGAEDGRGAAVLRLQSTKSVKQGEAEAPQEHGRTDEVPQ